MKFIAQFFFKGLYYLLTDKSFRKFVVIALIYGIKKHVPTSKISINNFKINILHNKSFVWQYYEIYFKKYYNFLSSNKYPIIIDCGANLGLSILNFKEQYPNSKVYAFEADKDVFKVLSNNINSNLIEGITLVNKAVWHKNEIISFLPDGVDGGKVEQHSTNNSMHIEAIDFKEFLDQFDKIDFLKIDIEGAETDVIPHIESCFDRIDKVFVEFHSFKNSQQKIESVIGILSKHYRLYIDNPSFRNEPFFPSKKDNLMDLQLNIFAYKD
jgi:FkbM family methyltransferase